MVCTPKYQIELYLRQFQQIYRNPQDSWCALQARLRIRPFILSCRDTFKGRNSSSMLSTLMAAMHDLQSNWELYLVSVISQLEGVHVQRSKEDIHTACFRCKGQLWMVCMHNSYWESRALWQFIVSAEDFFKTLAMFVSQAVSQFWYTKADSYAACFQTSCQSSGWFARQNIRLNCTCDSFSRFTKSPGQLMCPAGKATYSHFHSFLQRYF